MGDHTTDAGVMLSPKERRERIRLEMAGAILEAARAVMKERGVAGLSLREVARRVRLQAPSLYAYFPSKMALYDGLYRTAVRLFQTYQPLEMPRDGSFWDTIQAKMEGYMRFAYEHPDLYQLAMERPVPGFVPSEESLAVSREGLASLERIVRGGIDSGYIDPSVSPTEARDLFIAMTHGLTAQHMANEPDVPVGSGRYGGLIPSAVALFRAGWEPNEERRGERGHMDRSLVGRTGTEGVRATNTTDSAGTPTPHPGSSTT